MYQYLSDEDFEKLKKAYAAKNRSFKQKLLFHVGCDMGFFSEIGGMLECMMYCYHHKIEFVLYADTANFADQKGWEEFFVPFCKQNHNRFNQKVNRRVKCKGRKAWLMDKALRLSSGATYLTYDVFYEAIGSFKTEVVVDWPEMKIKGTTWPEYHKLLPLALRFNKETRAAVDKIKSGIQIPKNYHSIQIRGGDKITEFSKLLDVDYCIAKIEEIQPNIENLFVFTDDYSNVMELKEKRPDWGIFTLTGQEERGYQNAEFNAKPWDFRKKNLLKLFSMIELCIESNFHFGCEQACVNNIIRATKPPSDYYPLTAGTILI